MDRSNACSSRVCCLNQPRILMLDETTVSLDNRTQAIAQESLGKPNISRLAIVHRVSTVREVARTCVLEKGRSVDSSNYNEPMARDRAFANLAKHQLMQAARLVITMKVRADVELDVA